MSDESERFQSLLSWISVNCEIGRRAAQAGDCVSILVVVDLGQLRLSRSIPCPKRKGFNPCCRGSRSTASTPSSLTAKRKMFQSLLSWISVNCTTTFSPQNERSCCFNPCCRGSRSTASRPRDVTKPALRFQSLLSWISVNCDRTAQGEGDIRRVSILVVVDLGQLQNASGSSRTWC